MGSHPSFTPIDLRESKEGDLHELHDSLNPCGSETPAMHDACPSNYSSAAPPAAAKRKRKARKTISEEQLDALHPGNVRHRAVLSMLRPALSAYSRWLQSCPDGNLPWNLGPGSLRREANRGASPPDLDDMPPPSLSPSPSPQAEYSGERAAQAAEALRGSHLTDWSALYEHRHSLKPKIHLPRVIHQDRSCDSSSSTAPQICALHNRIPESSSHSSPLFGSIVSNASDHEVMAIAHGGVAVLLPARSRFLMSHGVGTLGPLLEVRAREAPHKLPCANDPPIRTATFSQEGSRYSLVVMDPPWENASARRSKAYNTLPARELLRLPLPSLLDKVGAVFSLAM